MKIRQRIKPLVYLSFVMVLFIWGCRSEEESKLKSANEKFIKGELKEVLYMYGELVKKDSGNTAALLRLASTKVSLSSDAEEFLKEIFRIGKKDNRVKKFLDMEKFERKFVSSKEKDNRIRTNLSERIKDIPSLSDEIGLLTDAIERNPGKEQLYLCRGLWFYLAGDHNSAIKDFSKAIELRRNFSEAYRMRGTSYFEEQNYDLPLDRKRGLCNAWFDFYHAVHINPRDKNALFLLALCYMSLDQNYESEKYIEKYIRLDTKNPQIRILQNHIKAQSAKAAASFSPGNRK